MEPVRLSSENARMVIAESTREKEGHPKKYPSHIGKASLKIS